MRTEDVGPAKDMNGHGLLTEWGKTAIRPSVIVGLTGFAGKWSDSCSAHGSFIKYDIQTVKSIVICGGIMPCCQPSSLR